MALSKEPQENTTALKEEKFSSRFLLRKIQALPTGVETHDLPGAIWMLFEHRPSCMGDSW